MKRSRRDYDDDPPVQRRRSAPQQDYSSLIRLLIILSIVGAGVGLVIFLVFIAIFGLMASKVEDHHREVQNDIAQGQRQTSMPPPQPVFNDPNMSSPQGSVGPVPNGSMTQNAPGSMTPPGAYTSPGGYTPPYNPSTPGPLPTMPSQPGMPGPGGFKPSPPPSLGPTPAPPLPAYPPGSMPGATTGKVGGMSAAPVAPVGANSVALSNLKKVKGVGGNDELEVDFEFTAGAMPSALDIIVVKTTNGTGAATIEVRVTGRNKGTIRIKSFGFGKFTGKVEVWAERKAAAAPGAASTSMSNTVTLN